MNADRGKGTSVADGEWSRLWAVLLADSVVYGASRYLSLLSSTILTPIYTRLLTKADYGLLDLFVTWNTFASMVVPAGLPTAVLRYAGHGSADPGLRTTRTMFSLVVVFAVVYALVLAPLHGTFNTLFSIQGTASEIYFESLAIVALTCVYSFQQSLLRAHHRKFVFAALAVTNLFLTTSLGFLLVYWYGSGVAGFFRASVIGLAVTCVAALPACGRSLRFGVHYAEAVRVLKYSLPLVGVFLLFQISNVINRLLITNFLSLSHAGIYAIASRIATPLGLIVSSFGLAWFPYAMSKKDDPSAKRIYSQVLAVYIGVTTILFAMTALFREEIIAVFAPGYAESYGLAATLALYQIVMGFTYVATLGLHISEKTSYIGKAAVAAVALNIVASASLLPLFGLQGIALGSLAGSVVWVVLQIRASESAFPLAWSGGVVRASVTTVVASLLVAPMLDSAGIAVPAVILAKIAGVSVAAYWIWRCYQRFNVAIS